MGFLEYDKVHDGIVTAAVFSAGRTGYSCKERLCVRSCPRKEPLTVAAS